MRTSSLLLAVPGAVLLVMVVGAFSAPCLAQAPPGWSRGQQILAIKYDECVQRAPKALAAEGFRIDHTAGNSAVGQKDVHTAVILCNPAPDGKLAINIVVASNGEGGGAHRERLQAQMERANPVAPGGGQPVQSGSYLTVRVNGRVATVDWANAPTPNGAWVSIVTVGTPDGAHIGKWTYTERKSSGRYENGPLEPGAWEARFYGDGGYGLILDRVPFRVAVAQPPAVRYLSVQIEGERALVSWSNAPTTGGTWVSVVPAGTADDKHVGKWVYTEQSASGRYDTGPLSPGEYEARFYGDRGYDKILDRVRFRR